MTSHLTSAELDALLEAAKAATPGPWDWSYQPAPGHSDDVIALESSSAKSDVLLCTGDAYFSYGEISKGDAKFIALANPATITRLVLMVRELQQAIRTTDGTGIYDEHGNYTLLAQNAIENRIEHFRAKVITFCKERAAYYEDQADRARNNPVKIRAYARANMASEVRELIESLPLVETEEA